MLIDELRGARLSAGWSRTTLAERIGVDTQIIKRLEKGVGSVMTLTAAMTALDFRLAGLGPGKTLHDQLRACREKRSLSLDALVAKTGLSRTTIASVERGGGSVASLLRLVAVLAPDVRRRARERTWWGEGDREDRCVPQAVHILPLRLIELSQGTDRWAPSARMISAIPEPRRLCRCRSSDVEPLQNPPSVPRSALPSSPRAGIWQTTHRQIIMYKSFNRRCG